MAASTDTSSPVTNPYAPPPPGAVLTPTPPPPPRPDRVGHWVWVEGPRQWAGLDIPLVRDPIFWVWAFFMATTTVYTVLTQIDTDKAVSILVVSWATTTAIYWFIPALARQVWRQRQARRRTQVVTVEHHPAG